METKELRLGNYLQLDGESYHVNEIQNSLQCIELKRKNLENQKLNDYEECDLDCNDLQPIPLTEEVLLKCGFERHIKLGGYDGYLLNGWFITTDLCFMVLGSSVILSKLKYLHQLQNLYFALTGEELEIELC